MSAATAPGVQLEEAVRGAAHPPAHHLCCGPWHPIDVPIPSSHSPWPHRLVFTHIHYNSRSFL